MTKQQSDFNSNNVQTERWYDTVEDWELIEASFAMQYQIRLRQNMDMSWPEFKNLLVGLMPETPLGQIIQIRATKDPKEIKKFNPSQRKIYNEWRTKQANDKLKDKKQLDKEMQMLEKAFEFMFSSKT